MHAARRFCAARQRVEEAGDGQATAAIGSAARVDSRREAAAGFPNGQGVNQCGDQVSMRGRCRVITNE